MRNDGLPYHLQLQLVTLQVVKFQSRIQVNSNLLDNKSVHGTILTTTSKEKKCTGNPESIRSVGSSESKSRIAIELIGHSQCSPDWYISSNCSRHLQPLELT